MRENQLQYKVNPVVVNEEASLLDKLTSLHEVITVTFGFVDRVAISVYNQASDELKTFIASCHGENTLKPTTCLLKERSGLQQLVSSGKPSVLKNLNVFTSNTRESLTCGILSAFAESYVMPVYERHQFYGFVIFNSKQNEVFDEKVLFKMDLFGHMISLMVMLELRSLNAGSEEVNEDHADKPGDPQAEAHVERMYRYARLIVSKLGSQYTIDKELIRKMCRVSAGQNGDHISVSDSLLIKAGCLTEKEYSVMKAHTELGREMIDRLVDNFSYEGLNRVGILSNMANFHFNSLPDDLNPDRGMTHVPLEAKIVAIADVFDVLMSQCGTGDGCKVFQIMDNLVVSEFDKDCVSALSLCREQIEDVRICYHDD